MHTHDRSFSPCTRKTNDHGRRTIRDVTQSWTHDPARKVGDNAAPLVEASVVEGLAAIPGLPRAALVERWTEVYGRPPSKGISRRLLEYAAAYHLQAEASGGLRPAVVSKLRRLTESGRNGAPTVPRSGPQEKIARRITAGQGLERMSPHSRGHR